MRSGPWVCIPISVSIVDSWSGDRGSDGSLEQKLALSACSTMSWGATLAVAAVGGGGDCWSSGAVVGLVGSSASVLGRLVTVLGALQYITLALAVFWLVTKSAGRGGVAGTTRSGCRQRGAARGCGSVRTRMAIDFLGLECCFDLVFVKMSQEGEG